MEALKGQLLRGNLSQEQANYAIDCFRLYREERNEELLRTCQRRAKEVEDLGAVLGTVQAELSTAKAEAEGWRKQAESAAQFEEGARLRATELEGQVEQEKKAFSESLEVLNNQTKKIEELEEQNEALQAERNQAIAERNQSKERQAELANQNGELTAKLDLAEKKLVEEKAEYDRLAGITRKLDVEVKTYKDKVAKLEADATLGASLRANKRAEQYAEEVDQARAKIATLEAEFKKATEAVNANAEKAQKWQLETTKANGQINEQEQTIRHYQAKFKQQEKCIAELRATLDRKNEQEGLISFMESYALPKNGAHKNGEHKAAEAGKAVGQKHGEAFGRAIGRALGSVEPGEAVVVIEITPEQAKALHHKITKAQESPTYSELSKAYAEAGAQVAELQRKVAELSIKAGSVDTVRILDKRVGELEAELDAEIKASQVLAEDLGRRGNELGQVREEFNVYKQRSIEIFAAKNKELEETTAKASELASDLKNRTKQAEGLEDLAEKYLERAKEAEAALRVLARVTSTR